MNMGGGMGGGYGGGMGGGMGGGGQMPDMATMMKMAQSMGMGAPSNR